MRTAKIIPLFLMMFLQTHGQVRRFNAVVQIEGWTSSGERIQNLSSVLTPVSGRAEEFRNPGNQSEFTAPTGEYILRTDAPGFEGRRQIVQVYQPTVLRTVALTVARIEGIPPYASLTGTVRNYAGNLKNLRVRLMSLYGNELRESGVNDQGSFRFPVDEGAHILLTLADGEKGLTLLDSKIMRIKLGAQEVITVDLKGKSGELLPE